MDNLWQPVAVFLVVVLVFVGAVIAVSHWLPSHREITVHVFIERQK